jgi:hypothetical protein
MTLSLATVPVRRAVVLAGAVLRYNLFRPSFKQGTLLSTESSLLKLAEIFIFLVVTRL